MNLASTSLDSVDARYRALVDVASALSSHSELTDLLRSLRGHLEPLIPFTFLVVLLRDRDPDSLVVRFFEPYGTAGDRIVGTVHSIEHSYPGEAFRTGRPVYVPQVRPGGPPPSDVLLEYGVASFCALPLVTARGALGLLDFG